MNDVTKKTVLTLITDIKKNNQDIMGCLDVDFPVSKMKERNNFKKYHSHSGHYTFINTNNRRRCKKIMTEEDKKIKKLQAEINKLQERKRIKSLPPQKTIFDVYFTSNKESNYERGKQAGLRGEQLTSFVYFCEVRLTVEVDKEGDVTILKVDGKNVEGSNAQDKLEKELYTLRKIFGYENVTYCKDCLSQLNKNYLNVMGVK